MMKSTLSILATTQNHNRGNAQAAARISEIYQLLKGDLSSEEANRLTREALVLKQIPPNEIEELMSSPIHLFCFPYAGGSRWMYENWQKSLPSSIRVHPIEYPGRGTRAKESLAANLDQLLSLLEGEVGKGSFAFFGHSLGALVAFELSLRLHDKYGFKPKALFLSGCPSPDTPIPSFRGLNDEEFIATLQSLNGIPPALLASQEFQSFFLPILRSDFSLMDGYSRSVRKVPYPIVLFGANRDPIVAPEDLGKWSQWTEEKIEVHEFEGDHFFIHEPKPLLERIGQHLCRS